MREKLISVLFAIVATAIFSNLVSAGSLSIASVSIPSSATQGDTFTLTMYVSGSGVTDVYGSLTLPSGISCTPSGSQSISLGGSGTGSASWSCTASVAGDYTNQITASVTGKDSGTGNSLSDTEQTGLTILSPASLATSSTISSSSIVVGSSVVFTVGVNNIGDTATTFNISLDCPSGLSCSPSSLGNTPISGKSLANNEFTITGNTAGTYTITATVKSPVQADMITSKTLTVTGGTTTTMVGGAFGTTAETGKVTKTFASIIAGIPKIITATDLETTGTQLTELYIAVKNRAVSVTISIEQLPQKPADVAVDVAGKAYRYIKITKENLDDANIQEGRIKFRVEKSWVDENNIDAATIALYRYSNGWNKLSTTKLSEDASYIYFEAVTLGFSYFAISGEAFAATTTTSSSTTTLLPTTTTAPAAPTAATSTLLITVLIVLLGAVVIFFIWKKSTKRAKTSGS